MSVLPLRINTSTTHCVIIVLILLAMVNPAQVFLAANLHEEYGGTYTPITDEHHIDAESGLAEVPNYSDQADVILIHRLEHLEWYHPDIYDEADVKQYRCRGATGNSLNGQYAELAETNNVIIITSWRSNRGSCIQNHNELESFQSITSGHYQVYTNY